MPANEDFWGDREADAIVYARLPYLNKTVNTWWTHSDPINPQKIVMVNMDETFICYASDARKLSRATGLPVVELNSIPVVTISLPLIEEYVNIVASKGIKLEFV